MKGYIEFSFVVILYPLVEALADIGVLLHLMMPWPIGAFAGQLPQINNIIQAAEQQSIIRHKSLVQQLRSSQTPTKLNDIDIQASLLHTDGVLASVGILFCLEVVERHSKFAQNCVA